MATGNGRNIALEGAVYRFNGGKKDAALSRSAFWLSLAIAGAGCVWIGVWAAVTLAEIVGP